MADGRTGSTLVKQLVLVLILISGASGLSSEVDLLNHLLGKYGDFGALGRPVRNTTDVMGVRLGVALIQILGIDEKSETAKLKLWIRHLWRDRHLNWEPYQFRGMTSIKVPASKIWTPDVVLYNGKTEENNDAMVTVFSSGDALWIKSVDVEISCDLDLTDFPNDEQSCSLMYSSWSHTVAKMDLAFYEGWAELNIADYMVNSEWSLLGYPAQYNRQGYDCCAEPFADLTFYIHIKRNPAFYNYVVIMPSVLLSSITLLIFLMPASSSDRNSYAIAMFAAFTLILVIVADVIPRGIIVVPKCARYLMANIFLVILAQFLSTVVTSMYAYKGKKKLSPKLEKIVSAITCAPVISGKTSDDEKDNGPENIQLKPEGEKDDAEKERYRGWKHLARVLDGIFFIVFFIVEIVLAVVYII